MTAQQTGKLAVWKADRGFGFIQVEGKKRQIFVHISGIITKKRPPQVGDTMYYNITTDRKTGKPKAVNVMIEGLPVPPKPTTQQKPSEEMTVTNLMNNPIVIGAGAIILLGIIGLVFVL